MLDVSREEITTGSIPRILLVLAAPLLVQNLVQVVQQVVDTFWLGRFDSQAIAAVGLNFPIVALLGTVVLGVGVGTQVLVSQRVGSDDLTGGRRAAFNGVVLGAAAGLVVGLAAALLARAIVAPLAPTPTVEAMAAAYLAIYAIMLPFTAASDALEYGFVGWGDTRAALYINVLAVGLNVVLDPVLIFGFVDNPLFAWTGTTGLEGTLLAATGFDGLGVGGAALATGLGYTGGFVLALGMAIQGRDGFVVTRDALTLDVDDVREIVDIGLPTAGQFVASQSVRVVVIAIVGLAGGAAGLTAYTIGARVASVSFIPAMGLQQAAQSIVGQNLGSDRPDRARRATWVGVAIAAGALTVVGAVQWAVPEPLSLVFNPGPTDAELELTAEYLRILAYGYWAIGTTYLLQAGFNGARRTRTSFVASLLQYWVVRLPIAALGVFVPGIGVSAVFWAVTLSNVAAAVGLGAYYWYETTNGMNDRAATQATAAGD